jgi:hypothetical protein
MALGMLGNTLKMKPWKQTQVLTDESYFNQLLGIAVKEYLNFCQYMGMDLDTLFDYYYRKSEVNLFRIRSKY